MLRGSLFAFAPMFAASMAGAAEPQAAEPPRPSFEPVLYRPWVAGESLPTPPESADAAPARLVPGPEYARRPYQVSAGIALLPFECLASRRACGSTAQSVSFGWRTTPHFAWALAADRTQLTAGNRYYLALGARVFAYERGPLDPFLELNLGGEVATEAEGVALAGEIVFGLGLTLVEHLMLAPTLAFRHSEHRLGVCRSALATCDPWSHDRTYWIALGLGVGAVWGPPH